MQRLLAAVVVVAALAVPAAAEGQTWQQPAAPLNLTEGAGRPHDGTSVARNVSGPVIEEVGGRLHAAWTEWDGVNYEVRVARLEGNAWVHLGPGCSPINVSSSRNAFEVSLADDDGLPIVAWSEVGADGVRQIEASRFDPASGDWVRPWGPVTREAPYEPEQPEPFYGKLINRSFAPDIEVVDGRPYIASRVVRLVPYLNQAHRLKADETSFEEIAAPPSSDSYSLAIETDGDEVYARTSDTTESYLTQFRNGSWQPIPRPAAPQSSWSIGHLAVRDGVPYVLSSVNGESPKIERFVDQAWQDVADVEVPGFVTSMVFVGATPYLATVTDAGTVRVFGLDGDAFAPVGTALNPDDPTDPDDVQQRTATLAAFDGGPWVGWSGYDGSLWQSRVAGFFTQQLPAPAPGAPAPDCAPPPPPGGETGGTTPPASGGGASTDPATGTPGTAPSRSLVGRLRLLRTKVRTSGKRRSVRLVVECRGPGRCRGTAVAVAVHRIRGMVLGRTRVNLAAGEARTIVLRLTPKTRRMLRRGGIVFSLRLRADT